MKRTRSALLSLLALLTLLCLAACGAGEDLWKNAIHKTDATVGTGSTEVTVEVAAGDSEIAITLRTDKTILGDALLAEGLITGEDGPYGLYVKTVNGIFADYDTDGTYWALYIDGKYAVSGVDTTPIEAGRTYRLSRDKG